MAFPMSSPMASPFGTPADERPQPKRLPSYFQRPVGSPPAAGQQQPTTPSVTSIPNSYFEPPQPLQPTANQYPTSQPTMPLYGEQDTRALTQQMGQIGLDGSAPSQTRRKKDRHAYHQMEQSVPSSQTGHDAQAGLQPYGQGEQQRASSPAAQWQSTSQPWQSQQLPPAARQLSAQGGAPVTMTSPNGGQQQMMGGGTQAKVNPDQAPSVPLSRDLPAEYYKTRVYPTMEQHLPPPATTPFVAYDQGSASPKFARLTLNCIPSSHEQLLTTGLPLGLVLQPLAKQDDGEQAIPVLDFGDAGPPRCRRCRAYINPFMVFSNGGNRMTCNLCGHPNEVAEEYFAPTDPTGVRVDRMQRPELLLGTCEFLVPKEYWSKEPAPMQYLFLIDISAESCDKGFLQGFCDGVLTALYGDVSSDAAGDSAGEVPCKVPEGAKVGFMTFNREIHFYNVSMSVAAPQQIVVSDLEEPFAALPPQQLFVDAIKCRSNITALLNRLPSMSATSRHPEPALLPALCAALAALEASGGKIICSLSALPTYGPGRLQQRDKSSSQSDDGEPSKELLRAENQLFRKCQADMVKTGVGVDFFLAAPMGGYLDVATIGLIAEKTGGETFYFPNWSHPRDCFRLGLEITHSVQRQQGSAALMKVRCSNGLQVAHYSGNFTQHTFGADLELASVTEDAGMSVTFTYDGKLDPKLDAHFQSALLYTTTSGQRRVRCSNVVASVTQTARESMRFVDQDAVVTVMAKESAAKVGDRNLKEIRQALQDKTIEILAGYRKNFSGNHPPGQLVMPENLKEFSMYVLGLIKSRALKGGREPTDRRVHEARILKGMGPSELSLYLYPRIIALHNLDPTEGFADENGHLKVPRAVRASFSKIEPGGVYLVDNGQILLLWLHQQVSPNLLEDLFGAGVHSLQSVDPNLSALPVLESHLNAQVRNILLHLESQRGSKGLAIQLARQGLDGAEFEFARLLYEDGSAEASSYVDWLVVLHRGVSTELSGQRSKTGEDVSHTLSNTISSITGSVPYWG